MVSLSKILLSAQLLLTPFSGTHYTAEVNKQVEVAHTEQTQKPLLKTAAYVASSVVSVAAVIGCIVWMRSKKSSEPKKPESNPKHASIQDYLSEKNMSHGVMILPEDVEALKHKKDIDIFCVTQEQETELKKLPEGDQLLKAITTFKEEYKQKITQTRIPEISQDVHDRIARDVHSFEKKCLLELFSNVRLPDDVDSILSDADAKNKYTALHGYYGSEHKIARLKRESCKKRNDLYKEAQGRNEFEQVQAIKLRNDLLVYQSELWHKLMPADLPAPDDMLPVSHDDQFVCLRALYLYSAEHQEALQKFIDASQGMKNYLCEKSSSVGKSEED